jgi:hypothetical protein
LDDHTSAVFVRNRLVAVLEVQDREAPCGESDAAVYVLAGAIGPAMREPRRHRAQRLDVCDTVSRRDPADPAHRALG